MIFCLCGCNSESVAETERRFVKLSLEIHSDNGNIYFFKTIYDKETNVEYLICNDYVIPLLNANGTPLLYGGE